MLEIKGLRRTREEFLRKIQKVSGKADVIENLRKLRIFSTITEVGNKLSVDEERRSISFCGDTTKDAPRGYFKMKFPNLFGNAENVEISLSTSKDVNLILTKPIIFMGLSFLRMHGKKGTKRLPSEEYIHTRICVEAEKKSGKLCVGHEKIGSFSQAFLELQKRVSLFDLRAKIGIPREEGIGAFLKSQLCVKLDRNVWKRLFGSASLSIGTIFGDVHSAEKYYLGENIRGYKDMSISPTNCGEKIGGNSFLEMVYKTGVRIGDARAFIFWSLGYVSEEKNIPKMLLDAPKAFSHRDSECFGASVGIGANVPIMKGRDGPNVDVSFSIPLTANKQIQRLQFGFDMDF